MHKRWFTLLGALVIGLSSPACRRPHNAASTAEGTAASVEGASTKDDVEETDKSASAPQKQTTAQANDDLLAPSDLSYGVYLNNAKVGWMRSTLEPGSDEIHFGLELSASVGGMGQQSSIMVIERRVYTVKSRALERVSFEQRAATGTVRIEGTRDGDSYDLRINAGQAQQTQRVAAAPDTLEDVLAPNKLARAAVVGATAHAQHFDASLQKAIKINYRVAAVESIMLDGVATQAVRIEAEHEGLGVKETSWLDNNGKILETRVGGFFVARLEAPEVARRLDTTQDLLASAAVKTPKPIANAHDISHLRVTFTGFEDVVPPTSPRQRVEHKANNETILDLSREQALPTLAYAEIATGALPRDVADQLKANPFVQSDAPEIKNAARAAAGDATTFADAVTRLTSFVYRHVRDEYVPAYSNALEALLSARGDCTEHSILFVALARAIGIPARVAVGIAYWEPGKGFGWHAWAEVFAEVLVHG